MLDLVCNFSDRRAKADLLASLGAMQGLQRIRISDARRMRSSLQNALYWASHVEAFRYFLMQQGQVYTAGQCHEMLKSKFLNEPVHDARTGELIGYVAKSTTKLTTAEFSEYLDKVEHWLSEFFNIILPRYAQEEANV